MISAIFRFTIEDGNRISETYKLYNRLEQIASLQPPFKYVFKRTNYKNNGNNNKLRYLFSIWIER